MRHYVLLALALPAALHAQDAWQIVTPPQSSLVYARDGSLIGEIGRESRTSVAIRSLPKYVGQAFVAIEDKRFYEHSGVDVVGLMKGTLKDALHGELRGGSTITQLLVGNMHPDLIDRREHTLGRKVREQQAAIEMERHYNKEQILEAFLNQVNFGHGWYGVESAARHYFGKPAAKLTLAEAASLAALPKTPVGYDPARFPAKNKQRRDVVLSLMAEQGYITAAQAASARNEPVVTAPNAGMSAPSQYFVDAVRQQLDASGVKLDAGGFRVLTTLDPALQQAAVRSLSQGIVAIEARAAWKQKPEPLQGLVVAVDPFTGDVRALVGGRDYATAPFNRATLGRRQPGSSFKPFVYGAAIEAGMSAATPVADTAIAIPLGNNRFYRPSNADNLFLGPMTMREAITRSRNPVAVQLAVGLGMDSVAAFAHRLGVSSEINPGPASAIGASVVRPLDFVAAYSAFDNGGGTVEPRLVQRVEDRAGHVLMQVQPAQPVPVVDPRVVFIVRNMLEDAAARGTGAPARRLVPASIPIAGKTGTTNDNVDVWFMGMTPNLVAGVWLGFDKPRTIMPGAAGGTLAAPIWGEMMRSYYAGRTVPTAWSSITSDLVAVEYDRASGAPADAITPEERRYVEYFIPGTEPVALRRNPWGVAQWGAVVWR
ncbi:MAG: penicillin-binding protein family [Gemmatimonadetes bacterium]|nr:penicillin-binding protein family [Gemmatimonadota bacterium]